jgi:hypothetical protein
MFHHATCLEGFDLPLFSRITACGPQKPSWSSTQIPGQLLQNSSSRLAGNTRFDEFDYGDTFFQTPLFQPLFALVFETLPYLEANSQPWQTVHSRFGSTPIVELLAEDNFRVDHYDTLIHSREHLNPNQTIDWIQKFMSDDGVFEKTQENISSLIDLPKPKKR